jgi:HK97 family phage major capsid protein
MITMTDLEACQTLEEIANLQGQVETRKKDLDAEFGIKPYTPEAQSEWASLLEVEKEAADRVTEVSARRAALVEKAKNERNIERPFAGRTIVTSPRRVPEDVFALEQYRNLSSSEPELLQSYRDGAMFAVERAIYPHPASKASVEQEHIAKLLDTADQPSPSNPSRELARRILGTGSPTYLRAFTKYLQSRPLSPDEMRAVAPLTVQTDVTGGYAVPFYFDPTLLHVGAWTITSPYRRACEIKTIVGTDTYHAPTIAAVTIARAAEAAASTEGGGAVGQISAIVGKVHGVVTISVELMADRPDIVSDLASLIAEAKDTEEESSFTLGIGDALGAGFNPIGMLCATTTVGGYTEIETANNNTFAIADVYSMEAGLPIRHRANAAWFMGRATIRAIQAMETIGGQLFGGQNYAAVGYPQVDPFGNTGLRLLNYPVWEVPSAVTGVVDSTIIAALAAPKSFYVVERAGMSVEVIPHIFAHAAGSLPMGQRAVYAWWRNTAKPSDVNAGRRLRINPA